MTEKRGSKEGYVQQKAREKASGCGGGWQVGKERMQEDHGAYGRAQGYKHPPDQTPRRQHGTAGRQTRAGWLQWTATTAEARELVHAVGGHSLNF